MSKNHDRPEASDPGPRAAQPGAGLEERETREAGRGMGQSPIVNSPEPRSPPGRSSPKPRSPELNTYLVLEVARFRLDADDPAAESLLGTLDRLWSKLTAEEKQLLNARGMITTEADLYRGLGDP